MTNISFYKNKTVLVTGASGYIGSALIKELKKIGCHHILDSDIDVSKKNFWVKYLPKTDIIFHLAAKTNLSFNQDYPLVSAKTNLLPLIQLIETAQKMKIFPDVIFTGTVTQAGLTPKFPVNENFRDEPITIYDINKLAAEKFLQYYSNQLGGRAVILRLSNVYGPGLIKQKGRGIVNQFIWQALKGKGLTVYGKGNYIRDYIYIDDVVGALLLAGVKINKLKGKYYILGSSKGFSLKEMVLMISNQVSLKKAKKVGVNFVKLPQGLSPIELRNFVADSYRFRKITGWEPTVDLKSGISKTIDYFIGEQG